MVPKNMFFDFKTKRIVKIRKIPLESSIVLSLAKLNQQNSNCWLMLKHHKIGKRQDTLENFSVAFISP
jgi:hypothetical protein